MTFPHSWDQFEDDRCSITGEQGSIELCGRGGLILETMRCTFQSAFQRQLFIKTFSGTYNQENVTTDVQSARGDEHIIAMYIIYEL